MRNKNIHLTDMARELQRDHSGTYRNQLLSALNGYLSQMKEIPITKDTKHIWQQVQQALTNARIILMEE